MSSYSITIGDIVPDLIGQDVYTDLTTGADGETDIVLADLADQAEAEFAAHLGGTFATAANLALAKPLVVAVAVRRLHARRANFGGYEIPDAVATAAAEAIKWAARQGAALLAGEGTVSPHAAGGVQYESPAEHYSMTDLDRL